MATVTSAFSASATATARFNTTHLNGAFSASATAQASFSARTVKTTGFPYKQLGFKAELLINGTWTDITKYVMIRDPVSITKGRTDESSGMQAGSMTLTLKNTDGRFTPNNSSGAYYPFVQLNTRFRLSVNDQSTTGVAYVGYRFWGEVSEWPMKWDVSQRDVSDTITVSGIWRRLSQSTKTLGSPFTRWNKQMGQSFTQAGYWPMEDGTTSTTFASLAPTGDAMTIIPKNGPPTMASCTAFPGSDAIPQLNGAELSGVMHTSSSPTQIMFRFLLFVQSGGDTGVPTGPLARLHLGLNTSLNYVDVTLGPAGGGPFTITGYDSGNHVKFTSTLSDVIWGIPIMVQVGLVKSGSNVIWSLNTIKPGTTTWYGTTTGTATGISIADASSVIFSPGAQWKGVSVGQAAVYYANPSITLDASALGGWSGENAVTRFKRICAEQNISAESVGTTGTAMGPQIDDTLVNVLQSVEDTDGGFLYETQGQFGLGYRTMASLQDQASLMTLSYPSGQVAPDLSPVNDDALVRNDITLSNYDGYSSRTYLAVGARSLSDPPNGIGTGYEYTRNVNSTSHSQVDALGSQLLDCGCNSQNRYPTVSVNFARVTTAGLFKSAPSMRQGDYFQITSMPAFMGGGTEKQLVWGWTEVLSNYTWTITYNTIPEAPWESSFTPGTAVTGQVPGSPVTASQSGSVSGAQIAVSAIDLVALSQQVLSYQFGGILSNINSIAPSSPKVGDLWFDSGNGFQIKRWDGSSWVPVTFDGSNILGAGTIVAGLIGANAVIAGNIAAGAVTATQLAAGIVKAGIVDATTITGAQFVATGTTGEVLVYAGTPATGNLIGSWSASSGTDGFSNSYNAGIWVYDAGGNSIGLVPGGATVASQLALSTGSATPTPPGGAASLYGAGSGAVQAIDGTDGQAYGVQRRSIVTGSVQSITSGTPGFWISTTVAGVGSLRKYRVYGKAYVASTHATVTLNFYWNGPSGIGGTMEFNFYTGAAYNTGGFVAGPAVRYSPAFTLNSGTNAIVAFDGVFTIPAGVSGTFGIQAAATGGTDTYNIAANSFMDIMPV